MIIDEARFRPWMEALRRHVTPDSVVLDIGCGAGILSLLACQFGARRVFAVEPDASIEVAKLCSSNNPGAHRIEWIRDLSTEIQLPEPADIVVGDLHGTMPFHAENIASMVDARKRHLKPGGQLLPKRDLLYAAPASAPMETKNLETPWRCNKIGLDLTAALPHVVNTWWRAKPQRVSADQLLGTPAHWGTVDYTGDAIRSLDGELDWTIEHDGRVDGLYVWFDGVVDDDLGFSNSPLNPELVYGRAFFPLISPITVVSGDTMSTKLAVRRMQDDWIYRWDTTITSAMGQEKASFRQSTFQMMPGQMDALRKSESRYLPTLTEDGQIERAILEQMDGTHALADIATDVMQRFPAKFPNFDQTLATVAKLSRRHG
ncbi:50S ribosomal protein L11 methyltransferase [Thermomonas sp.]|uniref:50S ribosomal protein L11 methyltransferase n=1 Tax=Thermomonas sp. TaxID=1971895 RepID=UPI002487F78F|nr:50S ribosomal protein L11 methyltransferase [Thermomonas sp.]MDI1253486.1 50S ribosomal protein L11 methyltransferase [Thermomonas sp.]